MACVAHFLPFIYSLLPDHSSSVSTCLIEGCSSFLSWSRKQYVYACVYTGAGFGKHDFSFFSSRLSFWPWIQKEGQLIKGKKGKYGGIGNEVFVNNF